MGERFPLNLDKDDPDLFPAVDTQENPGCNPWRTSLRCMSGGLEHGYNIAILSRGEEGGYSMNLAIWLPAMFFLGIAAMTLCYLFIVACEKI